MPKDNDCIIDSEIVSVFEHPLISVPVRMYEIDALGVDTTFCPNEVFSQIGGAQEYVFAPLAERLILLP